MTDERMPLEDSRPAPISFRLLEVPPPSVDHQLPHNLRQLRTSLSDNIYDVDSPAKQRRKEQERKEKAACAAATREWAKAWQAKKITLRLGKVGKEPDDDESMPEYWYDPEFSRYYPETPGPGNAALRAVELFEGMAMQDEQAGLDCDEWALRGGQLVKSMSATIKAKWKNDLHLRMVRKQISEKLKSRCSCFLQYETLLKIPAQHVLVLQKMPPPACRIDTTHCSHPFCPAAQGHTPAGAYRLSLEHMRNRALKKVPTKPEPKGRKGNGVNGVVWYCLTCIECLWNDVGLMSEEELLTSTADRANNLQHTQQQGRSRQSATDLACRAKSLATYRLNGNPTHDLGPCQEMSVTSEQRFQVDLTNPSPPTLNIRGLTPSSETTPISMSASLRTPSRIRLTLSSNPGAKEKGKDKLKDRPATLRQPKLADFRSISSKILPEERAHGSEYFTLSNPQRAALGKWKDAIMKAEMLQEKNKTFLERNNLLVPSAADEQSFLPDYSSEPRLGCMAIGGLIIEPTLSEVKDKNLSAVLGMVDARVQAELDAQGYKDLPYKERGPSIRLLIRDRESANQVGEVGEKDSTTDGSTSGSEDEQDVGG